MKKKRKRQKETKY